MYLRMIRAAFEKAAPKAGFRKSRTQTLEGLKAPQFSFLEKPFLAFF